jgi:hypothetical protein
VFAACAGARLPDTKAKQLPVSGSPSLMVGTMGGNMAEFGAIVEVNLLPLAKYTKKKFY